MSAVCAGRTDAGVHAAAQVIHFDSEAERTPRAWVLGTNTYLPPSIALSWAGAVAPEFHARHRASRRSYRYYIVNRSERPALDRQRAAWIHRPLDAPALDRAAQAFLGEHDFSAFRSAECQSKSPVRTVHSVTLERDGDLVCLEICASGFLHHMVRNIVGTLVQCAGLEDASAKLAEILASGDRRRAGPTAPPHGLYFWRADYAAHFGLPVKHAAAPFVGL